MASETYSIVPKKGLEADWDRLENFIPLNGEPITYLPDDLHPYPRMKIGDGVHLPRDLPFLAGNMDDIEAARVKGKLTFGNGGVYQYDGSEDVTVPVYTGDYNVN